MHFYNHPKRKILSLAQAGNLCIDKKYHSEKIVLTSGCFDLLHGGHLEYIYEAGKYGFLIVGINCDNFVKKLKGEKRPIRNEYDRALTMTGFFPVGAVVIFDCDYKLIECIQPNIYIASKTSHIRVYDDEKRMNLFNEFDTQVVELGAIKQDSTTDIIKRAAASRN
ncbi:MAG: adenylyltransferase/cytidyltransferase family protein [Candidatus Moraniibacteriota bacterium]